MSQMAFKRVSFTGIFVVLLFSMAVHSVAQTVDVVGYGQIEVVPDAFELTLTLENTGPVVSKLSPDIKQKEKSLLTFLQENQVEPKNIRSMQINLFPVYENTARGRSQVGIRLSKQISFVSYNLESYDFIIDGVLKRGVERIDSFRLFNSKVDEYKQQALLMAIEDAKQQAKFIAKHLGVELSHMISATQTSQNSNPRARQMMMAESSASMPGTMNVHDSVAVSFAVISEGNKPGQIHDKN